MELTTLETLKLYSQGQLVELPSFAENQPFVAKLKRPSLLALAKSGRVPNELLVSASKLFEKGNSSEKLDTSETLTQTYDMLEAICEASFVSPTYQELKDAGIELTDEQKMFVFSYAQNGVRALTSFRTE